MADVTVKSLEQMEGVWDGMMVRVRASLGVTSIGMQVENLPPNFDQYPLHDETGSGQEEVYIPLKGSATLFVGSDEYELRPGVFARVGPSEKRRIVPGPEGVQLLALGGVPGKPFEAADWSELGGAVPEPS